MKLAMPALNFRTLFWGGAIVIVVLGLAWAFRPRPQLVDVAEVVRGELVVTVQDEGRARARDVYVLSAPTSGQLVRVEKEPGDHVRAGEPAAMLLPPASSFLDPRTEEQAQAAVAAAEAAVAAAADRVRQAQADLDLAAAAAMRIETLADEGFASEAARDRARRDLRTAEAAAAAAQADRERAQAELASARAQLSAPAAVQGAAGATLSIRAPVSGRVLRVTQESETVLSAGAPIMEIADPADLEIVAEFLSSEAARIAADAPAALHNWGGQPDPLPGRVRRVEPSAFTKVSALGVEEQRVNVIIDLEDPEAAARAGLGDGWRVDAAVEVWRADDVLTAPVSTLFRSDGGWSVFRIEDGRARLGPVEVGQDNGVEAEIVSGLEAGDVLVLYPGEQISDGVRVRSRD